MNAIRLRPATSADAAALLAIYRPYIEQSAITFEEEVPTEAAFAARIETCLRRYPWLVAEIDGVAAGYAYAAPYNERAAYQWACLSSVYLADDVKGKGIARPLYETLFTLLRTQGYRSVFALITLPNDPSVRLHERCGFRPFTVFGNIGFKLGHWQEVGWWRLDLAGFPDSPPPPVPFQQFAATEKDRILAGGEAALRAACSA
ncbi:GNAT family N-acetyltransferase [Flaviaesturariibacter terrae]